MLLLQQMQRDCIIRAARCSREYEMEMESNEQRRKKRNTMMTSLPLIPFPNPVREVHLPSLVPLSSLLFRCYNSGGFLSPSFTSAAYSGVDLYVTVCVRLLYSPAWRSLLPAHDSLFSLLSSDCN
jgi:hypothetical protein